MGATLRVDPDQLSAAASAEAELGAYVSGLPAGQLISRVAGGMAGLDSGAACQFAGTVLDAVAHTVGAELSTHADRLSSAADQYRRADDELGRRLRRLAE